MMSHKIIHFNHAVEINRLFKAAGIQYTLHLHAGCAYCVPELKQNGEAYDIDAIYAVMNEYLKLFFIQVKPDDLNPLNVVVY